VENNKDSSDELKETRRKVEQVFLEFQYPESRDLLKHFLTLISASLVFSLTFSEKIIDFATARTVQKVAVVGAWSSLVVSLGACGLGIYTLYIVAERVTAGRAFDRDIEFDRHQRFSHLLQDLAGVFYGLGLLALVVAAIMRW
jgi:hypothetical protein